MREWTFAIFQPHAPLPARVLDCVGPARNATRRPCSTAGRRQNEAIRLCALEDNVRQSEQIGGPFEEVVRERTTRQSMTSGCVRRLLRRWYYSMKHYFNVCVYIYSYGNN